MANLEDAILLAVQAHRGQVDKAGQPYILHPLRVMFRVTSEAEMMTAILHDVVEDTPYTFEDLRSLGYSEDILAAVECLTRRDSESYEEFIERVAPNSLAAKVKIADLEDNMDIRRIRQPQDRDLARLLRYRRAWERLTGR